MAAASLALFDVHFVTCGRIPTIYLLDAVAEGLLAAAWIAALLVG